MFIQLTRKADHEAISVRQMFEDGTNLAPKLTEKLAVIISRSGTTFFGTTFPTCAFYQVENQCFKVFCPVNLKGIESIISDLLSQMGLKDRYTVGLLADERTKVEPLNLINERLLTEGEHAPKEIPEEFICSLLGQVMDMPVKLDSGQYVDYRAIERHLETTPTNPFTRAPLSLINIERDSILSRRINLYVFNIFSEGLEKAINKHLVLDHKHQRGYMSFTGNPYGSDSQLLDRPLLLTVYKTGMVSTTSQPNGKVISQVRTEFNKHLLNYPDPIKTRRALMDYYRAVWADNIEQEQQIIMCYPVEARKHFFEFKRRMGYKLTIPTDEMQRPFESHDHYSAEPHADVTTAVRSLI